MLSKLIDYLKSEGGVFLGIIGAVLTVYSGLQDVVTLAGWAETIVRHFMAASAWVWSQILFFLQYPISRLDATLLNLATFTAFVSASGLAYGHKTPRTMSEVHWPSELLSISGGLIAFGIIVASGLGAVMFSMEGDQYMALLDRVITADSDAGRETAARDFLGHMSAFLPVTDDALQALGYGVGVPVEDRIDLVAKAWIIGLVGLIGILPIAIALGARLLGYGRDSRRSARRVWRFNLVCLAVLALNGVSLVHQKLCDATQKGDAAMAICTFLSV
jgi:hypothetical protein